MTPRLLHVFDLDGTLLRNTTASLEIAKTLGNIDALISLEAAFAAGQLDTKAFAHQIGLLWRGLSVETVERAFLTAPVIGGVEAVLADIKRRDERSALITMSPSFFVECFARFGFDHISGSVFPSLPLSTDPDPASILTPDSKVTITDHLLSTYALPRSRCVAYGDSRSDYPLFATLQHTVAINATPDLNGISRHQYHGEDLWDAYSIARAATSAG